MVRLLFLTAVMGLVFSCAGAKKKDQTSSSTVNSDNALNDPSAGQAERDAAKAQIEEAIRKALTDAKTAAEEAKGAKGGAEDAAASVRNIMKELGLNSDGTREAPPAQTQTFCGKTQGPHDGQDIGGWEGAKKLCVDACAHDLAVLCTWDMLAVSMQQRITIDRAHLWVADPDQNCRGWTSNSTGDIGRTTTYLNDNPTSGANWQQQHVDGNNKCSDLNYLACCGPQK